MEVKSTSNETIYIEDLPNTCPFCFRTITPHAIYSHLIRNRELEVFFVCNNKSCSKSFIGYYEIIVGKFEFMRSSIGNLEKKSFSNTIREFSPTFEEIYNQAYFAEQNKLFQICGVGYRKAIEFLIKEYCIHLMPDKKEEVEKNTLANCIATYIGDDRIKSAAKRATWLGNDETHYVKKWGHKDLNDLKMLIDLVLYWIEMESLSSKIEREMPD